MPRKSPEVTLVVNALAKLLRRGLPVTGTTTDPVLLDLRGVIARAVDPHDGASRVAALNGLLRGLLSRFPDTRYAASARALFGLPPAEPGTNLTTRREAAALAADHEAHHFRKRVEPRLLEQLASALLADTDRFTRCRVIAPRLVPPATRQAVPADPFAWELAEHEEALCQVWAAIYAARAELLATERLISLGADRDDIVRQAVTAAWRWGLASAKATGYTAAFGDEVSARELVVLAGWTPALPAEQQSRLRDAATTAPDLDRFSVILHADTDLSHFWLDGLLDGQDDVSVQTTERLIS